MTKRHYEIVFLVQPEQTKEQAASHAEAYAKLIQENAGKIHRQESWGLRDLAYPINKLTRAHYFLMNIECDAKTLAAINQDFRYNENILRNVIIKRKTAITQPSFMLDHSELDTSKDSGKKEVRA